MFLKILVTAGALLVAWLVLFRIAGMLRPAPRKRGKPPARKEPVHELVKCAHCGIYLPAQQSCTCTERG